MSGAAGEPDRGRITPPRTLRPLLALTLIVTAVALVLSGLRVTWVRDGSLYGNETVWQLNAVTGALWALSALLAAGLILTWSRRRWPRTESDWRDTFDIATRLTLAGTVVAAFITVVDTWAPVKPSDIAAPACPGVTLWRAPYIGVTAVDGEVTSGVNTREGPGRSHPTNGRFLEECALGFTAFCIGDPINDPVASTDHASWVNSRWLLVAKHGSNRARILSGEDKTDQYVAEVLINPIRSYTKVPYRGTDKCPPGGRYPGKATIDSLNHVTGTLSATAPNATNIGFAVWKPAGTAFLNPDSYQQIYNPEGKPADNPGRTDGASGKTATWAYRDTLVPTLRTQPTTTAGDVVVMAIPCLAINVPATTNTADLKVYRVSSDGRAVPGNDAVLQAAQLNRDRLAHAACQAVI